MRDGRIAPRTRLISTLAFLWTAAAGACDSDRLPSENMSQASLSGTVTDTSGNLVPHGAVELWDEADTLLIERVLIDADGRYAFEEVPPGRYHLRLQPAEGYQLTREEEAVDPRPIERDGTPLREDFSVEPGWWVERFTQYEDTEDLTQRFPDPPPPGSNLAGLRVRPEDPVEAVLEPGAGPTGGPAYRMDYRRGDGAPTYEDCNQTTGTQGLQVLFEAGRPAVQSDQWWMRFVTREGRGPDSWFPVGNQECCRSHDPSGPGCNMFYKYIRLGIGSTQLGWIHSARAMGPPDELDQKFGFISGGLPGTQWEPADDPADWQGRWALWLVHLDLRQGVDNARYRIWRQKGTEMLLLHDATGTFDGPPTGDWTLWQLPGPMNEWPGKAGGNPVQRWWALIGFYKQRPATIPMELLVP